MLLHHAQAELGPDQQLLEVLVQDVGDPLALPLLGLGQLVGEHPQLLGPHLGHGRPLGHALLQGCIRFLKPLDQVCVLNCQGNRRGESVAKLDMSLLERKGPFVVIEEEYADDLVLRHQRDHQGGADVPPSHVLAIDPFILERVVDGNRFFCLNRQDGVGLLLVIHPDPDRALGQAADVTNDPAIGLPERGGGRLRLEPRLASARTPRMTCSKSRLEWINSPMRFIAWLRFSARLRSVISRP